MFKNIGSYELKSWLHQFFPSAVRTLCPLPDFLIVGAQKSGTSFLYQNLASHSEVARANFKEIHFFDNNFEKGINWYRSHFPTTIEMMLRGERITGEASPYYLYHPHAARRIASVLANVKLIILLRDPVDRAISHYSHEVNYTGAEDLPMEEAFDREPERLQGEKEKLKEDPYYRSFNHQHYSYLDRGNYSKQIKRYKDNFKEENIKIIKSGRMFKKPQYVFKKINNFLGIRTETLETKDKVNSSKYDKNKNPETISMLKEYYKEEKKKLSNEFGLDFDEAKR